MIRIPWLAMMVTHLVRNPALHFQTASQPDIVFEAGMQAANDGRMLFFIPPFVVSGCFDIYVYVYTLT